MATIVSHVLYRFDLNTIRLSTISGIHTVAARRSFIITKAKNSISHITSDGMFRALQRSKFQFSTIRCSASNEPSSSSEISSTAKIRSEVLTPFRSLRMFFYLAFIASGGLGGLIAISRLIGENNAKNAQIARLSREENLSNLKLRVSEKKIIPLSSFRGIARFVICAGPASYISEAFRHGELPEIDFNETEETKEITAKRKRLWQLAPMFVNEWTKWLDEQKKVSGVSPESPVYLSLRMDGRVRGSGVGYPPWNAFVAQLPPVKGMWSGLLDGMDGRV
ncbi:unnamed protein product [Rhodiola kirilowii]